MNGSTLESKQDQIIYLLNSANKSLAKAVVLLEFLTGEKIKEDSERFKKIG